MQQPQLSLGLPVYNGEDYLRQAIDSLLAQTFTDFELILCDNCSTDSTPEICQEYVARDSRVIYHRNDKNIGAAANFNKVVDLARGPYFAWANHDDVYAKNYFETCVSQLQSRPDAVLAYSRSRFIDEEGRELEPLIDALGLDAPHPHQRLRQFHSRINTFWKVKRRIEGLWIPVYGVIRTARLKTTGVIGPFIASDTILLEELLMHGPFLEVQEMLFFKRHHPDRSMVASRSFDDRIKWFTGRSRPKLLFPRWRLFFERLKATRRTKLGWRDKLACYREMLGFNLGQRMEYRRLGKEAWINIKRVLGTKTMRQRLPAQW